MHLQAHAINNMCTYIIYSNPGSSTPLLMATTRDENPTRKTTSAFLWNKQNLFTGPSSEGKIKLHFLEESGVSKYLEAEIMAPQDVLLGGTFLAENKYGVIAAVNNRENSPYAEFRCQALLGNKYDFRKMPRGGLALDALCFDNAEEAAYELWEAVKENQGNNPLRKYSGFNLVIADTKSAWVVTNAKFGDITVENDTRVDYEDIGAFSLALWKIPTGQASLLGGYDLNDFERSERTKNHLPAIRNLPLPEFDDFSTWQPWLKQMAYKQEFSANPFGLSICQPDPKKPKTVNAGVPGWVTTATHLMLIGENKYDWYGIEGQLLQGNLYMQKIIRNQPESWSAVIFAEDSLREFPGKNRPTTMRS